MTYHVMIKVERRISKERDGASVMNNDLRTDTGRTDAKGLPVYKITTRPPKLHEMCNVINEWDNIAYASEWDLKSPWIVMHLGTIADINMAYMGWPMVTKEEWEAAHPVEETATGRLPTP